MADAQAPLRAARSRPDRRSRLPLPGSLQAQLLRPRRPPPEGRGAFKPKGLSHEEKLPAPPSRRGPTPLHKAHDRGHVTGAPPGAAVEGGAVGRRDSARTVSRGGRGQRPRPAPPRPGGSYQRERHGVRRGPEGLTGGQAGGSGRRGTRTHVGTIFAASGARLRAPAGGFIKRRRAGLTRSTCAGPARPRPRPRPLRSLQPCGPALRRPPWAWRGGAGMGRERETRPRRGRVRRLKLPAATSTCGVCGDPGP